MRTGLAVGGLALAGLLAAGCSSGPAGGAAHPGTPAATPPAGGGAAGAAGVKFAELIRFSGCMRTHGVPGFPDPIAVQNGKPVFAANRSGVNQNSPQFSRADQTCRALLASQRHGEQALTAQDQVDYLKAAQCMRAHGVPGFPDPVFAAGGGVHFPLPASIDTHSTQVIRAVAICRRLIPRGLPYSR